MRAGRSRTASLCAAILALLLAAGLAAVAGDEPLRIVVIGDSNLAGTGSHATRWSEVAQQRLGARYDVFALGVPGATSQHWIDDHWRKLEPHLAPPPRLAVIALGSNDAAFGLRPPSFRRKLEFLVKRFLDAGAGAVMLVAPPHRENLTGAPWIEANLKGYRPELEKLCKTREHVLCGPDLARETTWPDDFLPDRLHFDDEAQREVGILMADRIREALASRATAPAAERVRAAERRN